MSHLSSPNFTVPPGDQSVQVRIIDSTTRINNLKLGFLMEPPMEGMEYMLPLPAWSFLIEHPSGQKILYDLGVPKDLHSFSPAICEHLKRQGWEVDVKEEVVDILDRNGIAANEISAIIWSHWHWDHIGDPSRFPSSTDLIVGPGFKAEFLPGYPAKVDAFVRESDFSSGRNLQEIDFTNSIQVGEFRAVDYFGDGSFYIIDSPGHAVGHLGALARTTTNPDTFIFMGGDLCHHSGEIRPSKHLRIPGDIQPSFTAPISFRCPGDSVYEQLLVRRTGSVDKPFFRPAMGPDIEQTIDTIEKAQVADADSNIWFIYAHDRSLLKSVDLFPLSANGWKEKKWREKTLWAFLDEFETAAKQI